ncbi:effector-associated constant component EACC1 [Micromonospora sp. URMC 103]|uniref:effector-associated constant component EACC1 n=1 Tax=Micromonospora sp. URMC 103 TaxID=3423406 RepID=UPI003F1D927C
MWTSPDLPAVLRLSASNGRDHLTSLLDWLRREDELRGRVRLEQPPPRPGEMGALTDALVVALGSGGAVAVLAGSLSTWLSQRGTSVEVQITGPDGRQLIVRAQRARDLPALVREVEALLSRHEHAG